MTMATTHITKRISGATTKSTSNSTVRPVINTSNSISKLISLALPLCIGFVLILIVLFLYVKYRLLPRRLGLRISPATARYNRDDSCVELQDFNGTI